MASGRTIASLLIACSLGCGNDAPPVDNPDAAPPGPDADTATLTQIAVYPQHYTFTPESGVADTRVFAAQGVYTDGSVRDISDLVTWDSYNASLVSINGDGLATSSTQLAGETQVVARIGAMFGQADVKVIQRRVVLTGGVPADAPDLFDAAALDGTAGRAPSVFYPYANTVIPPNFAGLEIHYLSGTGNNLYEVTLSYGLYEFKTYTSCSPVPGGCAITPEAAGWNDIAQRAKGDDLAIQIAALNTSEPGTKGVSSVRDVKLTAIDLTAGLYYWAATDGRIHRFDFGAGGVPPEAWYPAIGDSDCAACHSLSRDGTIASVDRGGSGQLELLDVATKTVLWEIPGMGFSRTAFSPDNQRLLNTASLGGSTGLTVIDVATGVELAMSVTDNPVDAPDWSPDGSMITFVQSGSIMLASYDVATDTFGTPFVLYSSFEANNPAFTPDSQYIIFNKGMELYGIAVAATPGTQPKLLGAAQGGYTGNTWAKMAPAMLPYEDGMVAFFTFSSLRPIGLKQNSWNQIFFAAFDPAKMAAGLDPSFSAVHLPWQSLSNGNHIAQWATDIVHEPCGPTGECAEEFECVDGECVPIVD